MTRRILTIIFCAIFTLALACTKSAPKDYNITLKVLGRFGQNIGSCGDRPEINLDGMSGFDYFFDTSNSVWKITAPASKKGESIHAKQELTCIHANGEKWFRLGEDPNPTFELELGPIEKYEISGIVKFQGRPVSGAKAQAYRPWDNKSFSVDTDTDGKFTMPFKVDFREGVRVTATYNQYPPYIVDIDPGDPEQKGPVVFEIKRK